METEDRYKVRSAAVSGTGRTSFRFDVSTWAAIDMVAERAGLSWVNWAAKVIEGRPHAKSKAAAIRAALTDTLMTDQFLAMSEERGFDLDTMQDHPLMRNSAALSDSQLAEILKSATVQGQSDFGGFTVLFGQDEVGQDCIWIKNGLRDRQHFAFIVPSEEKQC